MSQVSGEPYDQYVQRHMLDPLGMAHTTATEPVPAALAGDLARSYDSEGHRRDRSRSCSTRMAPDGSISASATDMAHFMIAHLTTAGRRASILSPATMALMHTRSFAADPRLGGYAHGFKDRPINGHRVLMHDGGWEAFESVLLLVPDCDLGLFLSANSYSGADAMTTVLRDFFDRFAPSPATPDVLDGPRARPR